MSDAGPEAEGCPACGSTDVEDDVVDGAWLCDDCGLLFDPKLRASAREEHGEPETDDGEPAFDRKRGAWEDHARVTSGTERQLVAAFGRIEELGNQLHLPLDVRERTAELYTEASTERLTVGRSAAALVPAAALLVSHEVGWALPLPVVANAGGVEPKKVARLRRLLVAELDRDPVRGSPADYLPYLAAELDCEDGVVNAATEVLDDVPEGTFADGTSPAGVAAAALYLAAEGEVTQREVALSAGLTTETVRVRLADLREAGQ